MSDTITFGDLLRRHRVAAGLSQEALAEEARLSTRGISDLERGARQVPRRDTVLLLADALGLRGPERATFEAAVARRRGPRAPTEPHTVGGATGPSIVASTLPVPPTPYVGDTSRVQQITGLLRAAARDREAARPAALRLITLTGPGGVGKTRLALEVAAEAREAFADDAAFVGLAAVRDPAQVLAAIAAALGLPGAAQAALETVKAALYPRALLLVLDNCEQVLQAAPLVANLLGACPRLVVLATSRAPLRVRGEQEIGVAPLGVPAAGQSVAPHDLEQVPAVALFVQSARALDPAFALTAATAPSVAEICRRLDGLPLAIELAAARGRLLPPQAMVARLTSRLALLAAGARDLPERQQTLRATLDWSHDLLNAEEQVAFRRLAVFVADCTIDAAQAVAGAGDAGPAAVDLLESLVEKSLLHAEEGPADGEAPLQRLAMLETVREYAAEHLARSGEEASVRDRHLRYFVALAERAEPELRGPRPDGWLERLEADHDNLRAALDWAYRAGEPERSAWGLRLAAALARFWYLRGYLAEGRTWLEAGAPAGDAAPPPARARALLGAAVLAEASGDTARAQELAEESLVRCTTLGDAAGVAGALNTLGNVARRRGDLRGAHRLYEQVLQAWRGLGSEHGAAGALSNLAVVARLQGDLGEAAALAAESLALRRRLHDMGGVATVLDTLGSLAAAQGDPERAAALFREALELWRTAGHRWGIATALTHLGQLALQGREYDAAARLFGEGLALCRDTGDRSGARECLTGLAAVILGHGRAEEAARLLGAASLLGGQTAAWDERDDVVARVRAALSAEAFAEAWSAGRSLPLEQALAVAPAEAA